MKSRHLVESVFTMVVALAVGGLLIVLTGENPLRAYQLILQGSFGSLRSITNTLTLTSVLLLAGLSVIVPFKARIWNLGIEGQIYMGGLGATITYVGLQGFGNQALVLLTAALFGSLWAGIAGLLKVKFKADEIVTTVLLNYIAFLIVSYAVGPGGPLRDTTQAGNQSWPIPSWGWLTPILGSPLNAGLLMSVVLSIVTFYFLYRTRVGYEIRTFGGNRLAARYAGISEGKTIMVSMLVSGALGGLAGALIIMSVTKVLILGFSAQYGFIGIAVAMLAGLDPVLSVFTSIFFSTLNTGGEFLQVISGIPVTFIQSLAALTILISVMKNNIMKVLNSAFLFFKRLIGDRFALIEKSKGDEADG